MECRLIGKTFEEAVESAWKRVVWPHDTTHRRQWKHALRSTMKEWRACYEGMPSSASGNMTVLIAALTPSEEVDHEYVGTIAA